MGDYNYDADDLGRTVAVSGPQGTTEYHYEDETGRLLEQTLYDNSEPGNKIAYTVYEYDNNGHLSRLAHYKPATPTDELLAEYDGRGNPTEYRGHELEFNQGNHLTAFDETLTAGYTSDGRRIWKEVNGQRTFFVYNGERVIGEMDASGNPTAVNTIGNTGLISREQVGNSSAI